MFAEAEDTRKTIWELQWLHTTVHVVFFFKWWHNGCQCLDMAEKHYRRTQPLHCTHGRKNIWWTFQFSYICNSTFCINHLYVGGKEQKWERESSSCFSRLWLFSLCSINNSTWNNSNRPGLLDLILQYISIFVVWSGFIYIVKMKDWPTKYSLNIW